MKKFLIMALVLVVSATSFAAEIVVKRERDYGVLRFKAEYRVNAESGEAWLEVTKTANMSDYSYGRSIINTTVMNEKLDGLSFDKESNNILFTESYTGKVVVCAKTTVIQRRFSTLRKIYPTGECKITEVDEFPFVSLVFSI